MVAIVECIPNFSEGRRVEVINAIVKSIALVQGAHVLHQASDSDHNRTVVTFAGSPQAVLEGAFAGIQTASQLIDLELHRGAHPRLGATDVVPFVPIQGVTMADCVALAHQLGKRVADELHLPVYLYEEAAQRPERRNLADIRRGEYEGLKTTIQTPERIPDYGSPILGKAGAIVIGARKPLIAFNVFLNTRDIRIASAVARAVRGSSGGLVAVKALGLLVDDMAQVSMNLVDYQLTPVHRVLELVKLEASRYGVGIARSELIGLIPQEALLQAGAWALHLHDYSPDQVLENRLKATPAGSDF